MSCTATKPVGIPWPSKLARQADVEELMRVV